MPRKNADETVQETMQLCDTVREAAFSIHKHHKHGHLEKVYENAHLFLSVCLKPPRQADESIPVVRRACDPDVHAGVQLDVLRKRVD